MASLTASPAVALSRPWPASRATRRGRYALVSLATVVAAVLANVAVYYLGALLVGYHSGFIVLANPSGIALFTVVPAIVAILLYAALRRFARRPARTFAGIAVVLVGMLTRLSPPRAR
jgi:hypothetical protein